MTKRWPPEAVGIAARSSGAETRTIRAVRARCRRRVSLLAAILLIAVSQGQAPAFPPYRSTDAGTADPWTLEGRLGLIQVEREGSATKYLSPLLRANLGLPPNVELLSEFQYRAKEAEVDDAAVGLKWVPIGGRLRAGVETLALLPNAEGDAVGIESLLLATVSADELRLHLNTGGFHDPRPPDAESGWKAGGILEARLRRLRPGIEVFAKQVDSRDVEIAAGPGLIIDAGPFDVRLGVRLGLTNAAADLATSLWLTTAVSLWRR